MTQVMIGIQARSGSTRLPKKAFELIGGKTMLDRVIERCKKAAAYTNRQMSNVSVGVVVVTPIGDPIAAEFKSRCDVVEGSEHDVLGRYGLAIEKHNPDLIVRVTGDCPLIPPFVISRLIKLAVEHRYDYVSNVDERFRTAIDGEDCEVFSRRLFDLTCEMARRPEDREHVTTFMRRSPPEWANVGAIVSNFDQSGLKLSVDTPDDLERVRKAHSDAYSKYERAMHMLGQRSVHRV